MAGSALALLVACGGGSPGQPPSKAAWTASHGDAVAALRRELATARSTLSSLQRPDILGACSQLRDSLAEAQEGLPVPDPPADFALRRAFDAVGLGTVDCIEGARGPDIRRLERSFSELREADTLMEVATRTIDAWT